MARRVKFLDQLASAVEYIGRPCAVHTNHEHIARPSFVGLVFRISPFTSFVDPCASLPQDEGLSMAELQGTEPQTAARCRTSWLPIPSKTENLKNMEPQGLFGRSNKKASLFEQLSCGYVLSVFSKAKRTKQPNRFGTNLAFLSLIRVRALF